MQEVCQTVQKYGPFIARILLAQLFIICGIGMIGNFAGSGPCSLGRSGGKPEAAARQERPGRN